MNVGKLIASFFAVSAAAVIGSLVTFPALSSWYAALEKPMFNPPNWVFSPVWTVLYILMAVSLYLVWTSKKKAPKRQALLAFMAQLVLNTLWSLVFFGLQNPDASVAVIFALLAAILATIVSFWPVSKRAAWLLTPYFAWVSFASILTISIALLN